MRDGDSDREAVELFHLLFLRVLCAGADKGSFPLKGGCNLRFFFGSVRYSEDLDLDVSHVAPHTLKAKVDRVLAGPPLTLALKSAGLRIVRVTAPKQTETTQRWKLALEVQGKSSLLATKIEFSRRETADEAKVEPIDSAVLHHYKLMPILAAHDLLPAALRQKVLALATRREVQARDLFDLSVLFARAGGEVTALEPVRAQLPKAIERAIDLTYDEYAGQVVAFLVPGHVEAYGSRETWNALQAQVVEQLQRPPR